MSATELQRAAVRMLHDPAFLAAVHATPDEALAGLDLTAEERGHLLRPDPRAWRIDVHRRWRVLTALVAEYAVSAAALRRPPHELEAFFASPAFHQAIRARRSLFFAFPEWLASQTGDRRARAMIDLEASFARVRRAPPRPAERVVAAATDVARTAVARAAWAETVALPEGALDAWQAVAAVLRRGGDPVAALVRGARPAFPVVRSGVEHVLVERPAGATEPVAGFVDGALHELMSASAAPRPWGELVAGLTALELERSEAEEILLDLVADRLLVPA